MPNEGQIRHTASAACEEIKKQFAKEETKFKELDKETKGALRLNSITRSKSTDILCLH